MDRRQELEAMRQKSGYTSVDPAPPLTDTVVPANPASGAMAAEEAAPAAMPADPASGAMDIASLRARLLDTKLPMFQRMRAVFSLRNEGGPEAVEALTAAFGDPSALLRHEIAYVLGQMQDPYAVPALTQVLETVDEHVMVRHEAAEALGAIGQEDSVAVLERYLHDPNPEVSESCEVALDLIRWVNSKELHYE